MKDAEWFSNQIPDANNREEASFKLPYPFPVLVQMRTLLPMPSSSGTARSGAKSEMKTVLATLHRQLQPFTSFNELGLAAPDIKKGQHYVCFQAEEPRLCVLRVEATPTTKEERVLVQVLSLEGKIQSDATETWARSGCESEPPKWAEGSWREDDTGPVEIAHANKGRKKPYQKAISGSPPVHEDCTTTVWSKIASHKSL